MMKYPKSTKNAPVLRRALLISMDDASIRPVPIALRALVRGYSRLRSCFGGQAA